MNIDKSEILDNLCYTELVYWRINKKLAINLSKEKIEDFIFKILSETNIKFYIKTWKNFYITNNESKVRLTINSYTFRIITVDKVENY